MQKASIRHLSGRMKSKQSENRILVMKLAHVAQDTVDIAEAVKCLTRHMKEPRSGHMSELEVGSIPNEEQEMRVDVCTTNVRSNVAGASGL